MSPPLEPPFVLLDLAGAASAGWAFGWPSIALIYCIPWQMPQSLGETPSESPASRRALLLQVCEDQEQAQCCCSYSLLEETGGQWAFLGPLSS